MESAHGDDDAKDEKSRTLEPRKGAAPAVQARNFKTGNLKFEI
jgi:hypothetical protein